MYYNHFDKHREFRDESRYFDRDAGKSRAQRHAEFQTIEDLLLKQRKGELMTREEKNRVTLYADQQRKKNLVKKKKKA